MTDLTVADQLAFEALPQETRDLFEKMTRGLQSKYDDSHERGYNDRYNEGMECAESDRIDELEEIIQRIDELTEALSAGE